MKMRRRRERRRRRVRRERRMRKRRWRVAVNIMKTLHDHFAKDDQGLRW